MRQWLESRRRRVKNEEAVFENIIAKNFPSSQTMSSPRFKKQYKNQEEQTETSDLSPSL